jgi:L-seryl-tRNA(Ser) seleniumtransferase
LADAIRKELGDCVTITLKKGMSRVGGGAFPEYDLPGTLVALSMNEISPAALREALLDTDPPLVARIEDDTFVIDLRTLASTELKLVAEALCQAAEALKE